MAEHNKILVVDLDGTLIKTDMLYESFWSAFSRNWLVPYMAAKTLLTGKIQLKSYLAANADIDVSVLPYDETVVNYINDYRAKGGRVALVTATHRQLADKIASYLGIFDEVFGTCDNENLKGATKAKFLSETYGKGGFCYMGDSPADLPVWSDSGKIVTVNVNNLVFRQTNSMGKPIEHLKTVNFSWYTYFKALRPHQWLKNSLIFLPMLSAHNLDSNSLLNSCWAFLAFCLIASSVYVLNDLLDLQPDRLHPRKRLRPFASGAIPIANGNILALLLLCTGFLIATLLGWIFALTIGTYYAITLAYSLILKRKIILDICVLTGLYTLRIVAGGIATNIDLSVWLLAFSLFFFLSLAATKRQAELVDLLQRNEKLSSGRGYQAHDLPIISMISFTAGYISVLVLALYINSENVIALYGAPKLLWGICCILIYWLTRISMMTHRGLMHDDPVVFAITDRISQICFIAILGLIISGIFF